MNRMVSVIVPAYNSERTIGKTIHSVLTQTYLDIELIIVDDGSTDNTALVVREFSDPRLIYIRQANQERAIARNNGIAQSRGEYVAFLDSDDWWLPDKVEKQVACLERNPNLGLVYCDLYQYDEGQGKNIGRYARFAHLYRGQVALKHILKNNFVQSPTPIVRRSVLDRVGGFDTSMLPCEDWELWIRVVARYPIDFINEPLAFYRQHPNSLSWERHPEVLLGCTLRVLQKVEVELVQEALATKRDLRVGYAWMYYYYARSLMYHGDYRNATQHYINALRYQPLHFKSYFRIAEMACRRLAEAGKVHVVR